MADQEEENKFVNLYRPKDIRLNALETVKEVIKSEKIYYKLKILRSKKIELLEDLKQESKELELLFTKLYQYFPEHKLIEEEKKIIKHKQINKKTKKSKKDSSVTAESELQRLEKTLALIEDKLRKL
jgi:hypothetical protein